LLGSIASQVVRLKPPPPPKGGTLNACSRTARLPRKFMLVVAGSMFLAFFAFCLFPLRFVSGQSRQLKQRIVHEGIAIEFSIEPLQPEKSAGRLREGDDVTVRFAISDTTTGAAVRRLRPAAWISLRTDAGTESRMTPAKACRDRVQEFLGGSLFAQAEIDLNVFYVLALNGDASISVVDPRFGFGGSKLLAMIQLKSVGADWVLTADEKRLFVSMPDANQIAVIDTTSWQTIANIDAGRRPARLALQPDQKYLWAADENGAVAIATDKLEVAARIPTGKGAHDLALSDDNRWAFVANRDEGTVSIIDVRSLRKVADLKTGQQPASLAYSGLSKMAYVAHEGDGQIAAIDGNSQQIVARMKAEPGLGQIRFAPGGRLGFVANPRQNVVYILDAADNRIKQIADVEPGPDQITFSGGQAYIRHRDSETVLMIPLSAAGVAGQTVPVVDFPGGHSPFGKVSKPSLADGIVPAPGGDSVLVANPGDRSIYFYKEGMAAPMGNFSNYSREPRAALVVDRSLRERRPGVYETTARLARAGVHDVSFFLDSPRLAHCFEIAIEPNPELAAKRANKPVEITPLIQDRNLKAGEPARLQFKLTDPATKQPKDDLKDLRAMAMLSPGVWHRRQDARAVGSGVYEIEFTPPQPGVYYVYLECPSLGLTFNNPQYLVLKAQAKEGTQEKR
ncbi:MAG: cytochrome D1 domain-containing protein, partial [Acidobacteriota bacterium]